MHVKATAAVLLCTSTQPVAHIESAEMDQLCYAMYSKFTNRHFLDSMATEDDMGDPTTYVDLGT